MHIHQVLSLSLCFFCCFFLKWKQLPRLLFIRFYIFANMYAHSHSCRFYSFFFVALSRTYKRTHMYSEWVLKTCELVFHTHTIIVIINVIVIVVVVGNISNTATSSSSSSLLSSQSETKLLMYHVLCWIVVFIRYLHCLSKVMHIHFSSSLKHTPTHAHTQTPKQKNRIPCKIFRIEHLFTVVNCFVGCN